MCRSGKLSKRPHSVRLSVSRRPFSSLIVSQPIKCFLKNNLLIIIIHIYSTYQYVSQGDVRISRETGEELNRVSWGTSKELFYPPHQFLFSTAISFWIFFFFYFLKGVSLPMLCQKVVLRLGSANMKTCCWGKAEGSEGCFCRSRKS